MLNFSFENPTRILFGRGQVDNVGEEAAHHGRRVLLVTGGGSVKRAGLYDRVLGRLKEAGLEVFELAGVEPNPRLSTVKKGIEICRQSRVEMILPVGGGSTIDASKAMAAGVPYQGDVWDFFTGRAKIKAAIPIGTILTLSATGTESNGNAVVTDWETHEKLAISSSLVYPRFSILDPEVTFSVPRDQTAYGAVDIMAHVFEQYFGKPVDAMTQERLCEAVLSTIIAVGPRCIEKPDDYDARADFMWSGTLALNMLLTMGVHTDWASHGIEHALSAVYDIPHGGGLAVVFPAWMRYVLPAAPEKFAGFAHRVWGIPDSGDARKDALAGIDRTEAFFGQLGVPTRLSGWGIDESAISALAEKAVAYGKLGTMIELGREDVEAILRAAR